MADRAPGKIIYIGSIPYDQTEAQIRDIARSIGPVVNMKMMFDKDTGRSKGYAFVEYADVETASSAVRNLNNYSIGNRQLKCDFSSENSLISAGLGAVKSKNEESLPPLPPGQILQPNENYTEAISSALKSLDPSRLNQIVQDCITMSKKNPILMEELLAQCPQLAYAIVETLLMTQRTDGAAISQILLNNQNNESVVAEAKSAAAAETSPVKEEFDEDQIALVKQVISISDSDLAGLPEDQKQVIMEIKKNYQAGVYGSLV